MCDTSKERTREEAPIEFRKLRQPSSSEGRRVVGLAPLCKDENHDDGSTNVHIMDVLSIGYNAAKYSQRQKIQAIEAESTC